VIASRIVWFLFPLIDLPLTTRIRRWFHRWSVAVRSHLLVAILILFIVAAVSCAVLLYVEAPADHVPEALIASLIGAVVTLMLVLTAVFEIRGLSRTASADLILRLTTRFFERDARVLVSLIEGNYLLFEEREPLRESYFLADEDRIRAALLHDEIRNQLLKKKAHSIQEVDDFLGQFEDLADLYRHKTLDIYLIWSAFSYYLNIAWENEAIQAYIQAMRTDPKADATYEGFEYLINKCNQYDDDL
jgi:hypothetical protein